MALQRFSTQIFSILLAASSLACCSRSSVSEPSEPKPPVTPPVVENQMDAWVTKGDESQKLVKLQNIIAFSSQTNTHPFIDVDLNQKFQSIDGFGYTLTGGSVEVLNRLTASKRSELLKELFSTAGDGIGVSYLRLSIGASDLNPEPFSYNDLPSGETDLSLSKFSLEKDMALITMLKEILAINPAIKIMATPWSPPTWMKTNGSTIGGELQPQYYSVYAQYFVKYIQEMKKHGINITAITPQNEPLHPGNNPSLSMSAAQQAEFIKNHLGPAFRSSGVTTKIVIYDHNADRPDYPIAILSDPQAAQYVDGSAFHLYGGDINALQGIHDTFPTKNLYFTEQYTASNGNFGGDLKWHIKNVIIGSMRNWSKNALEWNLANDSQFKPHTPGGCTTCKGAITVSSSENFSRNVAYYIIAHASKFVPQNSVRVASSQNGGIASVAFLQPSGKITLIALNENATTQSFNIRINGKWATLTLDAGAVGTYIF